MNEYLVVVVYDGILNPVFAGQVIQPILNQLKQNNKLYVHLVCFEKENISQEVIDQNIPKNKRLTFIKLNRKPVIGKLTLRHSVFYLKRILNSLTVYSLKARGPLAGWIALKSINQKKCKSFIVQARGLIAQEYDMFCDNSTIIKRILNIYRKRFFRQIEKEIYGNKCFNNFFIESITPALSNYLIKEYQANSDNIKLAVKDFPEKICEKQKLLWRYEIRNNLGISHKAYIFCYNGSAKPWQDLDMTIKFFKEQLIENQNAFLMILTHDVMIFENLLKLENIDSKYYKILTVQHTEIYKYLSACDVGILFRKPHIANWISRPIKAMEYDTVDLGVIHNNTVKWLIDRYNQEENKYEIAK